MVGGFNCFCLVVCCFLWIVLQVCWWCGLQSGVVFDRGVGCVVVVVYAYFFF